ncbi:uncharacterized protein LOC143057476 [Mytilus galloprovincialis]|uniref:uncharacterized protein LOC143057476 n=1 Tax=Mytilus galloprovincialis TaxID=29158 RepID=UPI003F7C5D71
MEKMYFVIFMITCTVFEATVNGCPSLCICTNTDVSCKERSLTTVPLDIPTSTRTLDLKNNTITRIDANTFKGLSALKELNLYGNKISTLDVNIFTGLTALQILWLSNNQISTLDMNIFRGLTALQTLNLYGNKISTLDVNIFTGLTALQNLNVLKTEVTCVCLGEGSLLEQIPQNSE